MKQKISGFKLVAPDGSWVALHKDGRVTKGKKRCRHDWALCGGHVTVCMKCGVETTA